MSKQDILEHTCAFLWIQLDLPANSVTCDVYLSADPVLPLEVMRVHLIQQRVFDEDEDGAQDEGAEQIHMDVVPHAMQLPVGKPDDYVIRGHKSNTRN